MTPILKDAVCQENSVRVILDDESRSEGAKGTVFEPVVVVEGAVPRGLSGAGLEEWIRVKCADLQVIKPRK